MRNKGSVFLRPATHIWLPSPLIKNNNLCDKWIRSAASLPLDINNYKTSY